MRITYSRAVSPDLGADRCALGATRTVFNLIEARLCAWNRTTPITPVAQGWLACVLSRIADDETTRLDELLS